MTATFRSPKEEQPRLLTAVAPPNLSSAEAKSLVRRINQQGVELRKNIALLHDREGWRALGYTSFKACVENEFVFGRQYAYRLLEAARTDRLVSPNGDVELPESHVRELAVVADEKKAEVYTAARKTAPNGNLTAEHIRYTIDTLKLGPNRWGQRATDSNWTDYLEALDRLTMPQIEAVLRKALPSIPSRVLFKAVDEARHMTPGEITRFNSAPWSHEAAA